MGILNMVLAFLPSAEVLLLLLIPCVAALIGWGTNWLAIKMTFNPLEFVGIKPLLGWQGIIPRNSDRIAQKTVDLVTQRLIPAEEVLARVDPRRLAQELEPIIEPLTRDMVKKVVVAQSPTIWEMMPQVLREQLCQQVQQSIPELFDRLLTDYCENLDEMFDLRGLVLQNLTGENKALLNELFLRCGREEFKLIIRCGLYFGALLGSLQAMVWFAFPAWWLLPLAGVLVGYTTNWLAIQMIFRQLLPKKFGFFTYQGLFLKRQDEVSREYADLLAYKVVIPSKIIDNLMQGDRAAIFVDTVHGHIEDLLDEKMGMFKGAVLLSVGTGQYRKMKDQVAREIVQLFPRHIHRMEDYWREAMDLETTIHERLAALPEAEFENVLRTCFKQDEGILIAVGGALGLVAGLLQMLLLL